MKASEYAAFDASALAGLISGGDVSAAEVQAAARSAIELVNPALNAVVGPLLDHPVGAVTDGPFAGVPFAIKDLVCHAAGVPQESGSELCRGFTPAFDTDLMSRWRGAGLAVLARTATPEFGLSLCTESRANGATHNPWDLSRSPGGSSGGSAALVASGALPFAHANDAAGSIRIPASLCGLVGLKPTRGRIPPGPGGDDPLFGTSTEFAVTRTVRDATRLYAAVAGTATGDRIEFPMGEDPASSGRPKAARPLRIAFSTASPFGGPVDPACVQAVEATAAALENQGHHVVEESLAFDVDEFSAMVTTFWAATISEVVAAFAAGRPQARADALLQQVTARFAERGRALSWHDVAVARTAQNVLTRRAGAYFEGHDVQLTPTVARPAWPVGAMDQDDPEYSPEQWFRESLSLSPFVALANVTGQPAISVPVGSAGTLPVGVQLTAAQGSDGLLLSLAAELEVAIPWAARTPTHHVSRLPAGS